jgi:hypothetical protein
VDRESEPEAENEPIVDVHQNRDLEPIGSDGSLLPFDDLVAPQPLAADPPAPARFLAFGSILVGGLLAGLIGYGVGDLLGGTETWAAAGGLIGGVTGAVGVAVVANLTLRAMNEWRAVEHPEAAEQAGTGGTGNTGGTDEGPDDVAEPEQAHG